MDRLELPDPDRVAFLTQTTLSVDETDRIIRRLRERFPNITGPKSDDICYATTNRQLAVRQMARECDLVLVIGSRNSSNSNRLVEVARDHGADSYLIDNETQVREEWLEGKRVVGISSGASAPEELVQRLVEFFRERGTEDVSEFQVVQEDVRFMLPREIRRGAGGAGVNCTPWSRRPGDSASTRSVRLVEPRLHAAARQHREAAAARERRSRRGAGVGGLDEVLAVQPSRAPAPAGRGRRAGRCRRSAARAGRRGRPRAARAPAARDRLAHDTPGSRARSRGTRPRRSG